MTFLILSLIAIVSDSRGVKGGTVRASQDVVSCLWCGSRECEGKEDDREEEEEG